MGIALRSCVFGQYTIKLQMRKLHFSACWGRFRNGNTALPNGSSPVSLSLNLSRDAPYQGLLTLLARGK